MIQSRKKIGPLFSWEIIVFSWSIEIFDEKTAWFMLSNINMSKLNKVLLTEPYRRFVQDVIGSFLGGDVVMWDIYVRYLWLTS